MSRWRRIVACLVFGGVIFLTLGPDLIAGLGSGFVDRAMHAAAYAAAMAAVLLTRLPAMARVTRRAWIEPLGWALVLSAVGAAMEVGQGLVGRDADPVDALANAAGIGILLVIWWLGLAMWWIGRAIRKSAR